MTLAGRSALITGASRGLGYAIAEKYVDAGASVLICGRDGDVLEEARERLAARASEGQVVVARVADVADERDAMALADEALDRFPRLTALVNNAGVYGPKGRIEEVDWRGWVDAITINLIGSVLLCRLLVPHFRSRHYGKIVQLSGGGATAPLPRISAYAASKAGIVRFVETLAEETRDDHIDINAIAPGALNTRLLDEVLAAGPAAVGQPFYDRAVQQQQQGGTPLDAGADLAVFLASAASDGITGKLLSAVWDPWAELPNRRDEISGDVYTLRRIVPADRGLPWG